MSDLNESAVLSAALSWSKGLGYPVLYGPDIALEEPTAESDSFQDTVLGRRLHEVVSFLNPSIPAEVWGKAVLHEESQTLASLHDSLLSKLISGDLHIQEAERFIMRQA